jgi:hypothetical protein
MITGPEDMMEEGTPFDYSAESELNTNTNSDLGKAIEHVLETEGVNLVLDHFPQTLDNDGLDDVG